MKSNFLKSIFSVGGGAVAVNLGRFLSVIIATRYIQPEKLGEYFLLMALIQVFCTVGYLGTDTAIVKFLAENNICDERRKIISSSFSLQIVSLLAIVLTLAILNSVLGYFKIKIIFYLLFINLYLFNYLNYILQGLSLFKVISAVNVVSGILKVVFVVIFVAFYQLDIDGLVVALLLSNLIPVAVQLYILVSHQYLGTRISFDKTIVRNILLFSYPLYLNNLFSVAFNRGYTIMIAWLLSPTAVAFYGIAERIPNVVSQVRMIYSTVFFPEMVALLKNDRNKAKELLGLSMEMSFVLLVIAAFVFLVFGKEIISLVFSAEYKGVSKAVVLLLFSQAFMLSGSFMGQTLVSLGENKAPVRINFAISLLIFGLCYSYLPRYGYMAAVYVTLFTAVIGYTANLFYLRICEIKLSTIYAIGYTCVSLFIYLILVNNDNNQQIMYCSILLFMLVSHSVVRSYRKYGVVDAL